MSKRMEHFSYRSGYGVCGLCTHIEAFKIKAGLG